MQAVDAKRTKSKDMRLAIGIQGVVRGALDARLRNKPGIPGKLVAIDPVLEIGPVDVGRIEIDAGRSGAVNLEVIRVWAATGILARPLGGRRKLRVDIHRQRVLRLPRIRDGFNIAGVEPRHKDLIGALSEYFAPRSALRIEVRGQ